MTQVPIVNKGFKYVEGLLNKRADDEIIKIEAGAARDSTNTVDIVVDSELSVNNTVSGAGGLDTGSVASDTLYALYVIGDSTKHNSPVGLLSLDFSSPTLPNGYDVFRRIGAVRTNDTSDNAQYFQYGEGENRRVYYELKYSVLSGGSATSFAEVDLSNTVPPISQSELILLIDFTPNSATNLIQLAPFGRTPNSGSAWFISGLGVAAQQRFIMNAVYDLDGSTPKLNYEVSDASDSLDLSVMGYIDKL